MNLSDPNWARLLLNDLRLVLPECVLVLGMCAVILVPFFRRKDAVGPIWAAALTLLLGLMAILAGMMTESVDPYRSVFRGALMIDPFSQFFKLLLMLFTLFVVLQWLVASRRRINPPDIPDFFCLLLGATVGMMLMASAQNLLMIVVATETASLPSFVLAGFHKHRRTGSESAIKYVLFGAAATSIMIYGTSLIYGCTGTLDLAGVAASVSGSGMSPLFAIGLAALLAGIGFKLSAVPMHFWCPDVFEGAPVAVTTFLSAASKGAAVILLVRVLTSLNSPAFGLTWESAGIGLAIGVAIFGAITAFWGNLMAFHQNHLRRLLAYSSIAHAGYMIMTAAVVVVAHRPQLVWSAILFYLFVYMFMNLGAFTVGALIAKRTGSEDIRDYAGLIRRSPVVSALMAIFLLSLFGMPGLGGFWAKIFLMIAMAQLGVAGYILIAVILINTLLSLYYYLRPVFYMTMAADDGKRPVFAVGGSGLAMLLICAAMLLWTGIVPGYANRLTSDYATLVPDDSAQPNTQPITPAKPEMLAEAPRQEIPRQH